MNCYIRPSALGKKNCLFIGHPEAGERSAVIYTLPGSCRRHGLNLIDYLKDLYTCLPAARITQIKEFTPAAWAKAKAKEKVVAQAACESGQPVKRSLPYSTSAPCRLHSRRIPNVCV